MASAKNNVAYEVLQPKCDMRDGHAMKQRVQELSEGGEWKLGWPFHQPSRLYPINEQQVQAGFNRNELSSKMTGTSIISSLADNICVYGTIIWPLFIGGTHTDVSIQRAYRRYVDMINAQFAHVMTQEDYDRYWKYVEVLMEQQMPGSDSRGRETPGTYP